MERIEELKLRLKNVEERNEKAKAEANNINSMTFRQKVEYNQSRDGEKAYRFKEMMEDVFKNFCKKQQIKDKEQIKQMFEEYWEMMLDEKITKMQDYYSYYLNKGEKFPSQTETT
jgi:uncharacterized protein (DUF3084 family)